jgi:hypothetical protein
MKAKGNRSVTDEDNEKKTKGRFRTLPARQILLIGGAFILGFVILGVLAILPRQRQVHRVSHGPGRDH